MTFICSRSIASRFAFPTFSVAFCTTSIRRLMFSFRLTNIRRNAAYRSRVETISRRACFSATPTGRKGMTNPMIWSTDSILSTGRVNCSEPWKLPLISWTAALTRVSISARPPSSRSGTSGRGSGMV